MISTLIDLSLLWIFLAFTVFMVILAVRARRVEQEEGLPKSEYRVLTAAAVCALAAILVVLGTFGIFRPSPGTEPAPKPAVEKDADPELVKLENEYKELRSKMAEIQAKIKSRAKKSTEEGDADAAETEPATEGFNYRQLALLLVPLVVLVGGFLIVYLGDPRSLMAGLARSRRGSGSLQSKAQTDLDAVTAAAAEGRFRDGLTTAEALDLSLLEPFEQLDAAYLKSYCAVQLAMAKDVPADQRTPLLESAARTLATLLEEAPNRGEAVYLLAVARGLLGESASAVDGFEKARELLPPKFDLPFANNQSVCLLDLAEKQLSEGNAEGSGRTFDRVTKLKVLVDQIPTSLVKVRLLTVRRALQANQLEEAKAGLEVLRKLEGLNQEQKQNMESICDALEALVAVRGGDDAQVAQQVSRFLDKHLPSGLPRPDDGIADEYLDTPLAGIELRLTPEIYRAFLFLRAEVAARIASKQGGPLSDAQIGDIALALLQALQFQLRQRDVLAALGGLYFWFVPDKKRKALEWLQAAVDLGVDSRIARRILERSREIDTKNKDVLDWFRGAAARFLHDPTVHAQVRQALVEELGRFQGFEPLLLELDPKLDQQPQEPTLTLLRQRASYMEKMLADLAQKKGNALTPLLEQLRKDYTDLIGSVDVSTQQMTDIERKLMQEIGKTVLT